MSKLRQLVLWGGTGHARVIAEAISGAYEIAAIFDRRVIETPIGGVDVHLGWRGFENWRASNPTPDIFFAIAIGGDLGADRLEIDDRLQSLGLVPLTISHRAAYVSRNALLGEGAQILAGAVLGANACIGRQTILNTRASVDHDCILGDGVHVAPGATVCGEVEIADCAFIGAGATILPRLRIGKAARIGAGAVVTRDVPPRATVLGVPARARSD